jgi:hypothetical protein
LVRCFWSSRGYHYHAFPPKWHNSNIGRNEHQLLALRQMVDDAMELMVDEGDPVHRIGELLMNPGC